MQGFGGEQGPAFTMHVFITGGPYARTGSVILLDTGGGAGVGAGAQAGAGAAAGVGGSQILHRVCFFSF